MRRIFLFLLPTFLYFSSLVLAGSEPTDYEQLHLETINYARSAPLSEAARLGIDLNEGPPETPISNTPKQPLAFNTALVSAARLYTLDMLTNNYFEHYSLNGDAPWNRMTAQGYSYSYAGENIAWRGSTGTVSPASGGYSLSLSSGTHNLTFKHDTLGTVTKSVSLLQENVKLDIKKTDFPSADLLSSNRNSSTLLAGQSLVITIGSQPISVSSGISIHFSYGFGANQTVYAVVLTPWDTLYFITGTNLLEEGLTPYTQGAGRLIDLSWPNMRELDGEYVVLVVVTPAGADPLNMQTWLDYELVRFTAIRNSVACTMDAMQCPDGSYVGRQPPDCAFASCPNMTKSEKY